MKQAPGLVSTVNQWTTYLSQDFLGGPRILKFAWVINFQKFGTFFFVLGLMYSYNNFQTAAWVYLALHGTYGFCWLMKHWASPDPRWETRITLGGGMMSFMLVLGPYWSFPFLLISGILGPDYHPSGPILLCLAICLHTLGLVIMFAADTQKYYTLKYRKGLITEGMFRFVRHPNYLGEMMLYSAYAVVVGHWIPWMVLGWVWTAVFLVNMLMKEASMSRYPGWETYRKKTGMLLPWKWFLGFSKRGPVRQDGA